MKLHNGPMPANWRLLPGCAVHSVPFSQCPCSCKLQQLVNLNISGTFVVLFCTVPVFDVVGASHLPQSTMCGIILFLRGLQKLGLQDALPRMLAGRALLRSTCRHVQNPVQSKIRRRVPRDTKAEFRQQNVFQRGGQCTARPTCSEGFEGASADSMSEADGRW